MAGPTTLFQTGVHGSRPAAGAGCVLYWCTTHNIFYRSDGSSWANLQDLSSLTTATRASLGLDTTDSPQFAGINLGHASDTTLARVSAGVVSIEGTNIVTAGAATSSGLTMATGVVLGRTTASTGAIEELSAGSGITISGGTISASGSAGAMTLITDTTLAATATNVTFSSISGSYKHLLILFQCRSDRAATVFEGVDIQFNSDTGNNYDDVNPDSNSSAVSLAGNIAHGAGWLASTAAASATSGAAGSFEVRINNYAATVFHKQWFTNGHVKYGTGATDIHVVQNAGSWRNTAAITDIKILTRNGSNFIVGSRFTLYGIS